MDIFNKQNFNQQNCINCISRELNEIKEKFVSQDKMWDGVKIRESYYLSQIKACKEMNIEIGTRFEDKVEEDLSLLEKFKICIKKIRNLIRD